MKLKTYAAVAATLLALTACSSGSTSDNTPGDSNPTPQATNTNTGTPNPPAGGDFCSSLEAFSNLQTTSTQAETDMNAAISAATSPNDPAAVAAVQAWGAASKADAEQAVAYLQAASNGTSDQAVKDALASMIRLYQEFLIPVADAAVVATDTYSYALASMDQMSSDDLSQLMTDVSNAGQVLADYTMANCTP